MKFLFSFPSFSVCKQQAYEKGGKKWFSHIEWSDKFGLKMNLLCTVKSSGLKNNVVEVVEGYFPIFLRDF